MSQYHIDPASGRPYEVGPDGVSRWVDLPQSGQGPQFSGNLQPRKTHRVRNVVGGVIGAFLALGVIGSLVNNGDNAATTKSVDAAYAEGSTGSSASAKSSAKAAAPAAAVAKIGSTVRDGKFEFTVTGTKTASRVGDEYLNKTAQGQFLLMSVTVKNIGDKAQLFDASDQKLIDVQGREYSADSGAGIYLGDSAKSFLEQINPGNSVKGTVVFDIPKDTKIDKVELHDSMLSGGVDVKLTK